MVHYEGLILLGPSVPPGEENWGVPLTFISSSKVI